MKAERLSDLSASALRETVSYDPFWVTGCAAINDQEITA